MIETEQAQFAELLGDLFGAHSRNVKADIAGGYWKGLRRMSLEQFRACVEASIERLQHTERGVAKPPTVAEIWDTHRQLTRPAAKPLELDAPPDHKLDGWDINANLHLLNYVTVGLVQKSLHDQKPSRDAGRYAGSARTAILVRWKDEWARDMRRDHARGAPLDGKKLWAEYMEIAERQLDELIATERVAA